MPGAFRTHTTNIRVHVPHSLQALLIALNLTVYTRIGSYTCNAVVLSRGHEYISSYNWALSAYWHTTWAPARAGEVECRGILATCLCRGMLATCFKAACARASE